MEINDIIKVLWRRKWILMTIPIMAFFIAYFVSKQMPQTYKSTAQLATGFTTGDPLNVEDQRMNAYESSLKFSNLIEIINSRLVVSLVSYNLMLHDITSEDPFRTIDLSELEGIDPMDADEINELKELLKEKVKNNELLTAFSEEDRKLISLLEGYEYDYETLKENLRVQRLNVSDFVIIEFLSEDPRLSAYVVNKLSEEFIKYNKSMEAGRSDESVQFYSDLVANKKQVLEEKRETLKAYKSSNNVLNFALESDSKVQQLNDLEAAQQVERQKIYGLELSIQEIDNQLSQLENSQNTTNKNIVEIRDKINNLNARYRDTGSNNTALKDSIDILRNRLQVEMVQVSSIINPDELKELKEEKGQLSIDLAVARSSLNNINSTLENLHNNVSVFANKEATIAELEREVEEAGSEYQRALEKYNFAKNSSLALNSSIRQVLAGQPSGEPESGKIWIISALAGMVSFALCTFIILVLAFLDTSLKNPAFFIKATGIPLIGQLNYLPNKKMNFADIFKSPNGSYEMQKFNHLLKKLRYEIESSEKDIFLVTSTKEGEGKTFTIASLAYALSLTNKKILLIDTNFKNNSLTQLFLSRSEDQKRLEEHTVIQNRGNEIALLSPNNSSKEEENDFYSKGLISRTMLKGIDIIGSKGGNYSPSEIFSKKNFKFLVEELSLKYDYIFLEGTALNEYSDTKELIEFVDAVIPVFSSFSEINQHDKYSIEFLKGLNGKLIGSVLNKVKMEELE